MAKFIKRSERKLMNDTNNENNREIHSDGKENDNTAENDYIKRLIEAYDSENNTEDASAAAVTEISEDGFDSISLTDFDGFEQLPQTDSDIIKQYMDSAEFKYAEEKRAAEIKRGRHSFLHRESGIDPTPEIKPEIEHKIHKVKTEHSNPGDAPENGKFADDFSGTRKVEPVKKNIQTDDAVNNTKKFIRPDIVKASEKKTQDGEAKSPFFQQQRDNRSKSKLFSEKTDIPNRYPEYSSSDKQREIKAFLKKIKKISLFKMLLIGGAFLVSLIFSFIPIVMSIGDTERTLHIFGGNGLAYGIVMFVLFLVGTVPLINDFAGGIAAVMKKKADSDTAVLLIWAAVIVQNIVLLINSDKIYTSCNLYNTAALAIIAGVYSLKISAITRTTEGFKILIKDGCVCAVRSVDDANRTEKIGQGILEPEARIAYRANVSFVDKFINSSLTDDPSQRICTKILPLGFIAAIIVFAVVAVVKKDICSAVSSLTAVIIVTAPLAVSFSLKWLLDSFNRRTNSSGGVIPSYSAAASFADNDSVIFDASELYSVENLNVFGAKTFNDFCLYDMMLYAAAMFINSDSPLGGVFKKVIAGKTELLPKVESLLYEDKQGLSAWIDNKKVLAGSRDLLVNHNIKVPPESLEEKYTRGLDDRKIVYISVEGEISAMIVVSYDLPENTAGDISYLVKHGYTILLRSTDANINDKFTESQLHLPADTVKVINTEAAEYFKMCRNEELKTVDSCIFGKKDFSASLKIMTSSVMLKNALVITTPLAVISSVLGLAVVALLAIFAGAGAVSGYHLFLLQAVWTVIGSFACRILAKK